MFSVEAPRTPISSPLGGSVSLPCTLSPALNAETFEVLWHRPQEIDTPVLSYKNRKIQEDPTDPRYRGRVSLSGALEKGDVSLKLENLTLADKGDYVCRVEKTEEWYDDATVSLQVKISGSPPVLSVADAGEGQVNVSCHSHGWLPEPSLSWTDGEGRDLKHLSKSKFIKDSEGLVKVSSWLLVSSSESEWLSCSVGFTESDPERKECRVMPFTCPESWKGAFITVLILFILLLLCNVGMAVYAVLHGKGLICSRRKKKEDTERAEEAHPLNPSVEKQQQNEDPTADPPHQSVSIGVHDHQIPETKVDGPPTTGLISSKKKKKEATERAEEAQPLNPSVEKQQNEDPTADPPHQSVSKGVHDHQVPETKVNGPPPTVSTAEDVNQGPSNDQNSHTDPPPQPPPEWDQVKEYKEDLTIDPEETPRFFRITQGGKRVNCTQPKEDPEAATQKIFTLCREKFSVPPHDYSEHRWIQPHSDHDLLDMYSGVQTLRPHYKSDSEGLVREGEILAAGRFETLSLSGSPALWVSRVGSGEETVVQSDAAFSVQ
ncbi:hypothetical protein NFI96_017012, partial [Prochilodus magdalenae]